MLNKSQRKHLANSSRFIGIAQFAHYGFIALQSNDSLRLILSVTAYAITEIIALYFLNKE